jgi:hypothetical protein
MTGTVIWKGNCMTLDCTPLAGRRCPSKVACTVAGLLLCSICPNKMPLTSGPCRRYVVLSVGPSLWGHSKVLGLKSGLLAYPSLRRRGVDPTPVRLRFMLHKVALGQGVLSVRRFSRVSIIPPMLHTHLYLNPNVIRRTSGRSLVTFKAVLFSRSRSN